MQVLLSIVGTDYKLYIQINCAILTYIIMPRAKREIKAARINENPGKKCSVLGYIVLNREAATIPTTVSVTATIPNKRPTES